MRGILSIVLILFLCLTSCEEDPFETVPSTGLLEFSKDTVYLDTVFTNISSSTRSFKVYNRTGQNISIPSIRLGRGEASFYRLNVDGSAGKDFENVEILSRDSIYVFVEATIDFEAVADPLYTDLILFEGTESDQQVELVTLVQDAHFLYPAKDAQGVKETIPVGVNEDGEEIRVEGFYLQGSQVWDDQKPYVIYGYAAVAPGNELLIKEGARVYFHQGSGLLVEKNARFGVKGSQNKKVSISGDRLEEFFKDIPGQWGAIWLKPGSRVEEISHAMIKNGTIGVLADSIGNEGDMILEINNTEIYNTSSFGLLSRSSRIEAHNLVIANNGESSLACIGGGDYGFTHCTLANFWSQGLREFPALWLSNSFSLPASTGEATDTRALNARFVNCIVEGNRSIEFLIEGELDQGVDFLFENNLLRFNDLSGAFAGDPKYDFEDRSLYTGNVFNGEPHFRDVGLNDFVTGQDSDAIGIGQREAALQYPFDLLGVDRTSSPDAGAYQHQVFDEE